MESKQMTYLEFATALADAIEPKPTKPSTQWGEELSPKRMWSWHKDEWHAYDSPARLIKRAFELVHLHGLPLWDLRRLATHHAGMRWRASFKAGPGVTYAECAVSPEMALAMAFYQWKTGIRVELIEES